MSKIFTIAGLFVAALVVAPVSAQTLVDDDFTGFDGQNIGAVSGWGVNVNGGGAGGTVALYPITDTGISGIGEAITPTSPGANNADRFWTVPVSATEVHITFDMISPGGDDNQGYKIADNPNNGAAGGGTWINGFTAAGNWVANPYDGTGVEQAQHVYGAITPNEIVTLHMDVDALAATYTTYMTGATLGTGPSFVETMGLVTIQAFNQVRLTPSGTGTIIYDNLLVVAVPEPATICLLGLGSALMLMRRRRRRA